MSEDHNARPRTTRARTRPAFLLVCMACGNSAETGIDWEYDEPPQLACGACGNRVDDLNEWLSNASDITDKRPGPPADAPGPIADGRQANIALPSQPRREGWFPALQLRRDPGGGIAADTPLTVDQLRAAGLRTIQAGATNAAGQDVYTLVDHLEQLREDGPCPTR